MPESVAVSLQIDNKGLDNKKSRHTDKKYPGQLFTMMFILLTFTISTAVVYMAEFVKAAHCMTQPLEHHKIK